MLPHVDVHRRSHDHRCSGGKKQRGQEIVGFSVGKFRERIRGGWRNYESINGLRHSNMLDRGVEIRLLSAGAPQSGDDLLSGERSKGQRTDKLLGGIGHHHLHGDSLLLKKTYDLTGFVGRNTAANAESDLHRSQSLLLSFRG